MALNPFARGSSSIFDPFSVPLYSWDPTSFSFPTLLNSDNISPSHGQMYRDAAAIANTQVDWKETPHAHVFKANLLGLKKEEIKVEVEDGCVLSISGKPSKEQKEETDVWHCVERSEGSFVRKFRLPENAKLEEEKMKAVVEDGVLTVTIPKVEKSKTKKESKVRSIKIE